jgi:hypothetical protein
MSRSLIVGRTPVAVPRLDEGIEAWVDSAHQVHSTLANTLDL